MKKVSHYAAGPGDGPVPGGLLLPEGRDVNGGFPVSAVDLLTAVWNAIPKARSSPWWAAAWITP